MRGAYAAILRVAAGFGALGAAFGDGWSRAVSATVAIVAVGFLYLGSTRSRHPTDSAPP